MVNSVSSIQSTPGQAQSSGLLGQHKMDTVCICMFVVSGAGGGSFFLFDLEFFVCFMF